MSESAEGRDQLTGCGAPGNQSTERGGDRERWTRSHNPLKRPHGHSLFVFLRHVGQHTAGSGDMDDRLISKEENKNPGFAQRAFIASAYRCLHFFSLCFKTIESSRHIDGSNFIFSHYLTPEWSVVPYPTTLCQAVTAALSPVRIFTCKTQQADLGTI